jgi:hypothetical protein
MQPPELSLEQAYGVLLDWSKTLARKVENRKDEIFKELEPTKLQLNAPSNAAAALLVFNDVKKALEEVVGAVELVEAAIQKLDDREPI